jgi:hypothetical protein
MPKKSSTTVPIVVIRKTHRIPDYYRGKTQVTHDKPRTYGNGYDGGNAKPADRPKSQ